MRECSRIPADSIIDGAEAATVIPNWNVDTNCVYQKYRCFQLIGQCLPHTLFTDAEIADIWYNLQELNFNEYIEIDAAQVNPEIDDGIITEWWRVIDDDTLIGFYECMGINRVQESQSVCFAAICAFVMTLGKESFTQAWVARRVNLINAMSPTMNITNYITRDILGSFRKMYPISATNAEDQYYRLVTVYSSMQFRDLSPLEWVIEQSAASRITAAVNVAEVCLKLQYFNADEIIRAGVPEEDFIQLLRLYLEVLRNPFSTLYNIQVHMALYANKAYICLYVVKDLMNDESMANYRGSPMRNCVLSRDQMERIAQSIYSISTEMEGMVSNFADLCNLNRRPNEGQIVNIGRDYFAVGAPIGNAANAMNPLQLAIHAGRLAMAPQRGGDANQGPAVGGDDFHNRFLENINQEIQDLPPEDRRARRAEIREAERAAWPQRARNLPLGTTKVTREELVNRIKAGIELRSIGFKKLASDVVIRSRQKPLQVMSEHALNTPSGLHKITDDQVALFYLWGIEVPEAYRVDPPPYVPNQGANDAVPINRYTAPLRTRYSGLNKVFIN